MNEITNALGYPRVLFVLSLIVLWLAGRIGAALGQWLPLKADERDDFGIVQTATLTLLGLIIGFSFSMAISRYDQRKNYEEEEANAIGTEYVRANLLSASDAPKVRALLRRYLDQRLLFYVTRDERKLQTINQDTSQVQTEMWSVVQANAASTPTPTVALAVSGMNDVLNSQGYTLAAWRNRIPISAWVLMLAIALLGNGLVGYGTRGTKINSGLLLVLPLVLSIAFLLIADIDSPRKGFINVRPQNLMSLSGSLPIQ